MSTSLRLPAWRVWARSLLAPRERLLPGVGARIGNRRPQLVARLLVLLRRVPPGRVRAAAIHSVALPLLRRVDVPLEVPVAGGSRLRVETSDLIGRVLAVTGVWEPQVTGAFTATLSRGDVCVDVGANIGYFTLLASQLVGPVGHVYAVEPSPRLHAALVRNLELNGVANVTALRLAASDADGAALLYEAPARNRGASSLRPTDASETVPVETRRLSSLLRDGHAARLALVKIDVEGYELEVLRGLEPLLEEGARPAVVLELTPFWTGGEGVRYVEAFCARYGLQAYRLPREKLLTGRDEPYAPVPLDELADEQQELLLAP